MCCCHSIPECYVVFSRVKLSIRPFVLFLLQGVLELSKARVKLLNIVGSISPFALMTSFSCLTRLKLSIC